jgi:hypothetical protein
VVGIIVVDVVGAAVVLVETGTLVVVAIIEVTTVVSGGGAGDWLEPPQAEASSRIATTKGRTHFVLVTFSPPF